MNSLLPLLFAATAAFNTNTVVAAPQKTDHFIENTAENVVLDVPYVNQINDLPEDKKTEIRGTACGPTALTMVLNYLGLKIDLYDVISKLPDSVYIKGKMFYKLNEGPTYFGYKGVSFKNSPLAIYDHLKKQQPVILDVQNYDGITGHALVVVGMKGYNGEKADSLIIHDPWVEGYREFKYIDSETLLQPEGYHLPIGRLDPFVIE